MVTFNKRIITYLLVRYTIFNITSNEMKTVVIFLKEFSVLYKINFNRIAWNSLFRVQLLIAIIMETMTWEITRCISETWIRIATTINTVVILGGKITDVICLIHTIASSIKSTGTNPKCTEQIEQVKKDHWDINQDLAQWVQEIFLNPP